MNRTVTHIPIWIYQSAGEELFSGSPSVPNWVVMPSPATRGNAMRLSVPRTVGFAALYLLALVAGRLTLMPGVAEPAAEPMVWPPAGVAAVWLLTRRGSRGWPVDIALLGAITAGVMLAEGDGAPSAVLHGAVAIVSAVVFTVTAGRLMPGVWTGPDDGRPLTRLAELWQLIQVAALSALAGAALETVGEHLIYGREEGVTAAVRLVRDMVSILIFGILVRRAGYLVRRGLPALSRARWLECLGIFVASAAAYYYVFRSNDTLPIGFALIPITVWAATRMPTALTIVHNTVFSSVATLFTVSGAGPYAQVADPSVRALVIQLYIGILTLVGQALGLIRDERDELVQQLRVSEQAAVEKAGTMTMIVNSMTEGLAILDQHGRLVLRNPAAGRLLGDASTVAGGSVLGSDHGFFRPDGSPLTEADLPYTRALAGEDVPAMDVLVRNAAVPEGRIVRFNVARIAASPGGARHVVVVFHDVTADRRHRDELMSFAGRVAHQLLNPLTTIEGWAEVLQEELAGYQPVERVDRIQRAAARMRTFLNGLLAYAAARDGKLLPTTVNLALMVGDIVNSRLDQAGSDGAAPPYFEVGRLDPVEGDPVLVRQLLENLIDNAVALVPPGVAPYVSVSSQPAANGMVRIDVLDNGVGIPVGRRQEVFSSFHRGDDQGTGLELAICKRIVERHGGTIEAAANPYGSGARITCTLPAGRSAYARALALQWAAQAGGR